MEPITGLDDLGRSMLGCKYVSNPIGNCARASHMFCCWMKCVLQPNIDIPKSSTRKRLAGRGRERRRPVSAHSLRVQSDSACAKPRSHCRAPLRLPHCRPRTATPSLLIALSPRTACLTRHMLSQATAGESESAARAAGAAEPLDEFGALRQQCDEARAKPNDSCSTLASALNAIEL